MYEMPNCVCTDDAICMECAEAKIAQPCMTRHIIRE